MASPPLDNLDTVVVALAHLAEVSQEGLDKMVHTGLLVALDTHQASSCEEVVPLAYPLLGTLVVHALEAFPLAA
jgi:hypothetical protein